MASYRNIQMSFWTDAKVEDDFSPEDKYIYLWCMTNPHTNLCGCYEVSIKQVAHEVGYEKDSVEKVLKRLDEQHGVIRYNAMTKELLVLNWYRYHWSDSEKLNKPLTSEISKIKDSSFRDYLIDRYNERDNVTEELDPSESEPQDSKGFDEEHQAYKAAAYLEKKIRSRIPNKKPATERCLQAWADAFDKCHRLDGYEWDEIGKVLKFSQEDPFWQQNILSGKKFREKYLQLLSKMMARSDSGAKPSASSAAMDDLKQLHQMYAEEEA